MSGSLAISPRPKKNSSPNSGPEFSVHDSPNAGQKRGFGRKPEAAVDNVEHSCRVPKPPSPVSNPPFDYAQGVVSLSNSGGAFQFFLRNFSAFRSPHNLAAPQVFPSSRANRRLSGLVSFRQSIDFLILVSEKYGNSEGRSFSRTSHPFQRVAIFQNILPRGTSTRKPDEPRAAGGNRRLDTGPTTFVRVPAHLAPFSSH